MGFGIINWVFALQALWTIDVSPVFPQTRRFPRHPRAGRAVCHIAIFISVSLHLKSASALWTDYLIFKTFGRRNLLLSTYPFMALFQGLIALSFVQKSGSDGQISMMLAGMYLFCIFFSPGQGVFSLLPVLPIVQDTQFIHRPSTIRIRRREYAALRPGPWNVYGNGNDLVFQLSLGGDLSQLSGFLRQGWRVRLLRGMVCGWMVPGISFRRRDEGLVLGAARCLL